MNTNIRGTKKSGLDIGYFEVFGGLVYWGDYHLITKDFEDRVDFEALVLDGKVEVKITNHDVYKKQLDDVVPGAFVKMVRKIKNAVGNADGLVTIKR